VKADLPGEKIGSIVIPESARSQPLTGEVVLMGHKVTSVQRGDRVMFGSRSWSRFNATGYGFPYMLLKEEDILAVIE
jgi:co-chaperonin GroES (HSP10)